MELAGLKRSEITARPTVLNTYLVYLRFMLHLGDLTTDGYNRAITDVLSYIDSVKTKRPHFAEFVEEWRKASEAKFLLD